MTYSKTVKCVDCGKEEIVSLYASFSNGYRCKDCKKEYNKKKSIEKFNNTFSSTYYCKTCGQEIINKYDDNVTFIRTEAPQFCSEYCAKLYSGSFDKRFPVRIININEENRHLLNSPNIKELTCKVCKKAYAVYINPENVDLIDENNFICTDCSSKERDSKRRKLKREFKLFNNFLNKDIEKIKPLKEMVNYFMQNKLSFSCKDLLYNDKEDKLFIKFLQSGLYYQKSVSLSKLGFDFENPNVRNEFNKVRNLLIQEYIIEEKSSDLIEKEYGLSQASLSTSILESFGISKRNLSTAGILAVKNGRHSIMTLPSFPYKDEHHTDWQGNDFYLKSTYETELANMLDEYHINYTVNKFSIKYLDSQLNKERIGFPDFYLPDYNLCIETKSNYFYDPVNLEDRRKVLEKEGIKLYILLDKKILLKDKFPSYEDIKKKKYSDGRKELRKIFSTPQVSLT